MQVSIIIPVYNALALTKQCVESLFGNGATVSFEVIVVDNGSEPDVQKWLLVESNLHSNLQFLHYAEPLGFARSVNLGAALATGNVLIILNSDTTVTPGWMDHMYEALCADPSLGALTPSTNHAGEPAQMDFSTIDLSPAKALASRASQTRTHSILYLPQRLTFFCVALRREVWLAFNGLDEAYRVGNFEDDDLCLRLRVAGYRLGVAQHVFLYHHNNATFRANRIGHGEWMAQNAAVFARRARGLAEDPAAPSPRWPRRSAPDLSVVILPDAQGSLDRTLRSLGNQTIVDFEIVMPDSPDAPTRPWIAYVREGDILYPFHLEALLDALDRNGGESIFADGWVEGAKEQLAHPDAAKQIRHAPLLRSGWMHHASLDCDRLWEQSVPIHWPRITWEMRERPQLPVRTKVAQPRRSSIELGRKVYRRLVPLQTRLDLDFKIRKLIRRPRPVTSAEQAQIQLLREVATQLEAMYAARTDAGKLAMPATMPAIVFFNAVSWNSAVQRQHHFARGMARRGYPVLWIEPLLGPIRNWATVRPLQQVAPGVHVVRLPANARDIYHMQWNPAIEDAMAAALIQTASIYGLHQVVSLVNYPRWHPLVKRLREQCGWSIAFDCLDDQRALAEIYRTPLCQYEESLVGDADQIFTSSALLQQRLLPRSSILLHNACDYDLFSTSVSLACLQHLPSPIIGFFGALADWLDMDLIHSAALRFPDWSFVYIGPQTFSDAAMEMKWLRSINLPNITTLPLMDQKILAIHLADFDVCTMPFLDIPVTRSMNAVKLYEYLAAGKPVVSRDLPEIRHLLDDPDAEGLIALYSTAEQFYERLQHMLAHQNPHMITRRQAFARRNDWAERVDVLSNTLSELAYRTSSVNASSNGSKT